MNEPLPPGDETPDEALVRATQRGDERAFARLVRRHLRKAMAVALTYVDRREDAEDLVQETFQRAFQSLNRFDVSRPFQPWLFTILRNSARSALHERRARPSEPLTIAHPSAAPGPMEETSRHEMRDRIDEAVGRLPRMQRTCFQLCMVEGFTSAEAASAVGVAESTVRVHVLKARRALSGVLESWRDQKEER